MKVQKILHMRIFTGAGLSMYGGATVILDGSDNSSHVQLRVAFCNPKDVFCKKTGRLTAEKANIDVIPLRSLPGELGKLWKEVHRRSHKNPAYRPDYEHLIRNFLPKE